MWQKVIDMLRAKGHVGPAWDLCCPRHIESLIQVHQPDDFAKFSPEGGCREPCMDRLPDCGHRCQARCHSRAMHEVFRCEQPCQRQHELCGHPCQKLTCGEDCGRCEIILNNVQLPCGHSKDNVKCHSTQNLKGIRCQVLVSKTVSLCGHKVMVQCSQELDDYYRCPTPCGATLTCGHGCPGSCGKCSSRDLEGTRIVQHIRCERVCGRPFSTCNHTCPKRCHDGSDCGLCMARCEVSLDLSVHVSDRTDIQQVACKHSRCDLKCHEPCAPCIENCTWSCPHERDCELPCSAPCDRLPCNRRCAELLPCGHQCPGLCGETCLPEHCAPCGMKLDAQVDMIEFKEYRDIDLDETPVVALACGHFLTAETLDGTILIPTLICIR